MPAPEQVAESVAAQCASDEAGRTLSWAVIDRAEDRIVGHTTYLNISPRDRRLEIGTTYLAASAQRTGINAAMKLALLTHAQQDGILRAHRIMPDGTIRHTVVYSLLAWEWSGAKASLEHRLRR